ncbi:aryl-alcohol dehydrogenase [Teratosphaeria destructans]|uniref:Aryl-alcohol dehydrogenase n=1 Tax=Teratosphaeria destructans TaxID=418781 RepID=A0A9W7SXL3_9PEZI|nr:aryl-alcohol dehydrogenase [Teratosphaeria destructans]
MPEEMGGVVDDGLRVYGTKNVRVVDAGVIPIIARGNVIKAVHAIAEKASTIIKYDIGIGSQRG